VLRAAAWVAAAALFWGGARVYPLREFCGLRPPARFRPEGPPPLVTKGVLGVVRHPWYLAGLVVLWGRDLNREGLLTAGLLSVYLVLGAHLEEGRLLGIYGQTYRRYQDQVAGLVPGKPLLRRLERRFGSARRH
jgi:methanethiol S-methyltransferase